MSFIVDSYIFCHVFHFIFFFDRGDDTQGKMDRTYPHDGLEACRRLEG